MSIASGFTKMKNYILTSSGYKLLSRWTSSQTVHMGDGTDDTDTVEYRFGAMKGVTSSLATDNDEFALSASAGKNLQDQCTQLNQSLRELNEGMIYNDVRTGVVTVLPNSDISISDNTPINFKDYVPLATTIIATYGSSDAHSHGMLGSPAIKDNTTCCVRYKNLTESELKVDFTVRFYYLRNN